MRIVLAVFLCFVPVVALAAPRAYDLDAARSEVGIQFQVLGSPTRAQAPVSSANVALDFDRLEASQIQVSVDARRITTALPFVAQGLKSPEVLDASDHPQVSFTARNIRLNTPGNINGGATLTGDFTVKGITRSVTFQAKLFRQQGSEAGDLSRISVLVTGEIDRKTFGITAYPDIVGDPIEVRILARLTAR